MKPPDRVKRPSGPAPAPRPGRPRSQAARTAVLRAARALLDDGGLPSVTIEAVAARAGVGKPTIYRTWPNAHAVVMAALMDAPTPAGVSKPADSAVAALRRQLRAIVRVFASRTGRSVTLMLASAEPETELAKAFRHHFILARREEGRGLLADAVARRELRAGFDMDVALDLLYAPIFYRILVGHAPLDESFVDLVIDLVLRGLEPARRKRDRTGAPPKKRSSR